MILVTIKPINAVNIPNKTAITKGSKPDSAAISIRIRCHIMPCPSLTGMEYATQKANGSPIIDPRILSFLSLKIAYKITNETLIGINIKIVGLLEQMLSLHPINSSP